MQMHPKDQSVKPIPSLFNVNEPLTKDYPIF